jgi:hypothetical protein
MSNNDQPFHTYEEKVFVDGENWHIPTIFLMDNLQKMCELNKYEEATMILSKIRYILYGKFQEAHVKFIETVNNQASYDRRYKLCSDKIFKDNILGKFLEVSTKILLDRCDNNEVYYCMQKVLHNNEACYSAEHGYIITDVAANTIRTIRRAQKCTPAISKTIDRMILFQRIDEAGHFNDLSSRLFLIVKKNASNILKVHNNKKYKQSLENATYLSSLKEIQKTLKTDM